MLRERKERVARLNLVAPIAGTVLPPPAKNNRKGPDGRLPGWTGSPFDSRNRGVHFTPGELLCLVGDPHKLEGVLVVDQADVDLIGEGDEVEIKLDAYPTRTFTTRIKQIANDDLEISPPSLSIQHGGELDTKTDETGVQRPLHTSFQARTEPLDTENKLVQLGMRGRAKVSARWQTIGWRIYRFAAKTFHFDL
jgi:putative peptide zinc metalloprotease protein